MSKRCIVCLEPATRTHPLGFIPYCDSHGSAGDKPLTPEAEAQIDAVESIFLPGRTGADRD